MVACAPGDGVRRLPAGESVVELVVALTILGLGMVGSGSLAIAATRLVRDTLAEHRAERMLWAVTDSLRLAGDPLPGAVTGTAGRVRWTVDAAPAGDRVRLRLEWRGAVPRVRVHETMVTRPPPVLPPP